MTIEIFEDKIVFGNGHTISETSDKSGLTVNSNFYAKKIKYKTQAQGTVSGYTSGGWGRLPTVSQKTTIDKFPFSVNFITATDVGDLSQARFSSAGQSSSESGYTSGGRLDYQPSPTANIVDTIDKFPFVSDGAASDVGNLSQIRAYLAGHSSTENGYTSGGLAPPYTNTIDKFPFAIDADASGIGSISVTRGYLTGQSSGTHGYTSGGTSGANSDVIDKFPFASDADSTDVGNLTQARQGSAGQSSGTHGYNSGGTAPPISNVIDKFPFATDADATDVGDLANFRVSRYMAGQSSETHGYNSGGSPAPTDGNNTIDKFSFSFDANATDAGDLTQGRYGASGQQV